MPIVQLASNDKKRYSQEKILNKLKEFNQYELLRAISKRSIKLYETNNNNEIINLKSLSNILYLLLVTNNYADNNINQQELERLCNMVYSLYDSKSEVEGIQEYFINYYSYYFWDNNENVQKTANQWFLFNENNSFGDIDNNQKNLNAYFLEALGIKYEKYIFYIFFIIAIISKKGEGIITNDDLTLYIKTEKEIDELKKILNRYSKSFEELIEQNKNDKYNKSNIPVYNYSIFRDFPIIKYNSEYIVPIIHYLILRIHEDVYYDVNNYFIENEKNSKTTMAAFFGKNLENLLLEYITYNKVTIRYTSEFEYIKGKLSADIIINEGSKLILIQIKNKRTILKSKSGDVDSSFEDIKKCLLYAHEQNLKLISDKDFKDYLERKLLHGNIIKKIYSIAVTPEKHNFQIIPRITNNYKKEMNNLMVNYNFEFINVHFEYYNLSIVGFQNIIDVIKSQNKSFSCIINKYKDYLNNPYDIFGLGNQYSKILISGFDEFVKFLKGDYKSKFTQDYFKDFEKNILELAKNVMEKN